MELPVLGLTQFTPRVVPVLFYCRTIDYVTNKYSWWSSLGKVLSYMVRGFQMQWKVILRLLSGLSWVGVCTLV